MNFNKMYSNMLRAKGLVLIALVLGLMGMAVLGYSYTFEMDYSGPGSEYEASMERYRDEGNRQAAERESQRDVFDGSGREERSRSSERDRERAESYRDDHGV